MKGVEGLFQESKWVKGSFKQNVVGTVTHVEASEVDVDWICVCVLPCFLTFQEYGEASAIPGPLCDPSELVVLKSFQHLYFQVGERAICPPG